MVELLAINSEVDGNLFNIELAEKLYHYYFEVNPYPWMENNIKNLYEKRIIINFPLTVFFNCYAIQVLM